MITIGNYIYSVDDENDVRVWEASRYEAGEPPFLYQPDYPDGTAFSSKEDAEKWAVDYIQYMIDANNQVVVEE